MVLDSASNVFAGPEGYFKVVIDDFDGNRIKAWHFEDAEGNKSPNLSGFANGRHIDLIANFENKTISPFALRDALKVLTNDLTEQGMVMSK